MRRIGHQMARATAIVTSEPGVVMYSVAKRLHRCCANGKNNAYGYDPVHRAIKAGLIVRRNGRLFPVESI